MAFKSEGRLPENLNGPGFYAVHMVAAATQASLQEGAQIAALFSEMQDFLGAMHLDNPVWAQAPISESIALFEQMFKELEEVDSSTDSSLAIR